MDPLKDLKELLKDSEETESLESLFEGFGLDLKELEERMIPKINLEYTNGNELPLKYAYQSDSGFDLYSNIEINLPPLGRALIPTGVRFDVPENYEIQVRSKSGLALNQGLMVLNSPGTVDNSYTVEVKVILFNVNNHEVKINKGMKIAQAVLTSVVNGKWVQLNELNQLTETDRGDKGFGSTGIQK